MPRTPEKTHLASSSVLFIGGAGLPHWIWDDVRTRLPEGVRSAVAERPTSAQATLAEYADAAAAVAT